MRTRFPRSRRDVFAPAAPDDLSGYEEDVALSVARSCGRRVLQGNSKRALLEYREWLKQRLKPVYGDRSGERGKKGLMIHGALHGGDQQPGGLGFANATESADALGAAQNFGIFIQRGDDDRNLRAGAQDLDRKSVV